MSGNDDHSLSISSHSSPISVCVDFFSLSFLWVFKCRPIAREKVCGGNVMIMRDGKEDGEEGLG